MAPDLLYDFEGALFQNVRLMDTFLLGPFMVWFGWQSKLPDWARLIMIISGLMTMIFNYQNYLEVNRRQL